MVDEHGERARWRAPLSRWDWLVAGLTTMPLLLWWVSWYPGMLSSDSIAQLAAIEAGEFGNETPAIYSILVWLLTRVWRSPAAVTLVQVVAMVALLAAFVRRGVALGMPRWFAGGVVIVFAWVPAVGATTIALEVQVAQTIVAIWLLVELMGLAPDPTGYLTNPWSQARLGGSLALAWLLDHGGVVVVIVVAGVLLLGLRRRAELLLVPLGGAVALALLVHGPVYAAFSVDRQVPPVGEAYAPEIAAVYHHHPGWFDEGDRDLLMAVADLEVWEDAYRCGDGAGLLEDREFDTGAIRLRPGAYRGLLARATMSHPLTVLGHRVCAASMLFAPAQPIGVQFATYVYNVPPNALGIERSPRWEQGFNLTKAILVRVDQPDRLWLFWRPAIFVWPALAAAVTLLVRRRSIAWPGLALAAYALLAFATVREPSFREAFTVYALGFLGVALWWPAVARIRDSR